MYFICGYKKIGNQFDINSSFLVNEDESFKMQFMHLTAGGYQSKQALIADFKFNEGNGELEISDDVAVLLVSKYSSIRPRVFETKRQQHENSLQAAFDLLNGINERWGDKRPY